MCLAQVVLSKFVRQMGDLLPATLYIPYLRMLKGLSNGPQCSHYCFSLLKSNGAPHGKHHYSFFMHLKVRVIGGAYCYSVSIINQFKKRIVVKTVPAGVCT